MRSHPPIRPRRALGLPGGATLPSVPVVLMMTALVGCSGGESAETQREPAPPATGSQLAAVGERPTYAPRSVEGRKPRPPRPTVIAAGSTERGEPFELVAHGTDRGTCLTMTYPASRSEGGGVCGSYVFPAGFGPIAASGRSSSGKGRAIQGVVSSGVRAVEISYEDGGETRTFAAITEEVPRKVLRQSGQTNRLGVFVAFLPRGVPAAAVTATALDADGAVLGRAGWPAL